MKLKVEVYKNKFVVLAGGKSTTLTPTNDFSTSRLLIGEFSTAESCLKKGLKDLGFTSVFKMRRPTILVYPKEMSEGGLSEVEQRILLELFYSAGAKDVKICQ